MSARIPPLPAADHVCPGCGFSYAATPVERVLRATPGIPAEVRAAVAGVGRERLRRRPGAGVWSGLEYVCHVRDVYVTSTIRLHRAVTEDRPALEPMLNDLRARRFRYNDCDDEAVLDELAAAAAGFAEELAAVRAADWERQVTRLPGEHRDARWLARHALHEGQHHLRDITAVLA